MLKKRIIFILFYQDGSFCLSRNFTLQKVGNTEWLLEKFQFLSIGDFIDELIILDVSRNRESSSSTNQLEQDISSLMERIFVPLTLGGGIRNIDDVARYFQIGADKVSLNWAIRNSPELISEVVEKHGSQAVVASLDVRMTSDGFSVFTDYGENKFGLLSENLKLCERLGAGEVLITSIDKDGTASGLDYKMLNQLPDIGIPIIACGGAGKPVHFFDALSLEHISGVATGNLFNFIGSGFFELRTELCKKLPNLRSI